MLTLHDRVSHAFMTMQREIKAGSDAKAFAMLKRLVERERRLAVEESRGTESVD